MSKYVGRFTAPFMDIGEDHPGTRFHKTLHCRCADACGRTRYDNYCICEASV